MKVLLIDDHALFRDALTLMLEARLGGLELLHAGRLDEALRAQREHADIRLVLLDLALPDSSGVDGLRRWREQAAEVPVVVLSADERPETVLAAIDAGAAGFIPKTAQGRVLEDALRAVFDGRAFVPPRTYGTLAELNGSAPRGVDADQLALSPRQLEVLRLLIEGKTNKMICRDLALSESTVKTHLAAIFRRLGAETRTQAVVAAARLGLQLSAPATR